jgi:hypothetical protein
VRSDSRCCLHEALQESARQPLGIDVGPRGRPTREIRLEAYPHVSTHAHAFYLACDDAKRRLCNQAFFSKINLTEDDHITTGLNSVYETVLNPTNRLHGDFWQRTGQLHPDIDLDRNETTLPCDEPGQRWNFDKWWAGLSSKCRYSCDLLTLLAETTSPESVPPTPRTRIRSAASSLLPHRHGSDRTAARTVSMHNR